MSLPLRPPGAVRGDDGVYRSRRSTLGERLEVVARLPGGAVLLASAAPQARAAVLLSVTLVAFALVSTGLYLRPLWASEHTTLPAFLWLLSALPACGLWWFFHAADEHRSKRFPLDTAVGTFWGGVLATCAYAVTLSVIVAAGQAETIGAAVSAVAGAASVGVLIICFRQYGATAEARKVPLGDGGVALVCAFVALGAVALGAAAGALEAAARDIQSRADTLWLTPRGAELALRAAALRAFARAALCEEALKALVLVVGSVALVRADFHVVGEAGLLRGAEGMALYGLMGALGFASTENVLHYVAMDTEADAEGSIATAVHRAVLVVPLHVLGALLSAAGLGRLAKAALSRRGRGWAVAMAASYFVLAVTLHGTYDFFYFWMLYSEGMPHAPAWLHGPDEAVTQAMYWSVLLLFGAAQNASRGVTLPQLRNMPHLLFCGGFAACGCELGRNVDEDRLLARVDPNAQAAIFGDAPTSPAALDGRGRRSRPVSASGRGTQGASGEASTVASTVMAGDDGAMDRLARANNSAATHVDRPTHELPPPPSMDADGDDDSSNVSDSSDSSHCTDSDGGDGGDGRDSLGFTAR